MRVGLTSRTLMVGVALSVASPALAQTREVVDVAVGSGGQYDPSIKGDSIAYTDTSTGNADIVVYSIAANATIRRISGTGGAQEVEDIDGNFVVYRQWNVGESDAEILVHNLGTGVDTTITNDNLHQTDPAISGTTLVWTQFDADGNYSAIWTADLTDPVGTMRAISPTAGVNQIDPAVNGALVVWYEGGNIISYDLATSTRTTVATGADRWPDVNGAKIAYASGGNIYVSEAGNVTTITNDATTQRRPKVSAEFVAWENLVAAGDTDVLGFDSRTNTYVTLAGGAGLQELHDLDGTNLAFTDRSTDAAGDIKLSREVVGDATIPDPCDDDDDGDDDDGNNGHGNDADHDDESNPGQGGGHDRHHPLGNGHGNGHDHDGDSGDCDDEPELTAIAADATDHLGGCSVATNGSSPWAVLGLLALAFLRRRRV